MKNWRELEANEILSQLLRATAGNNLGEFVDGKEFKTYANSLLSDLNKNTDENSKWYLDETDFDAICKKTVESQDTNLWGREVKYADNKLYATYGLSNRNSHGNSDCLDVRNFLYNYICSKRKAKEIVLCDFDISKLTGKQRTLSKQIAAYITYDLIKKYIDENIDNGCWPSQCKDIEKYILGEDLASVIELDGTRENFIELYKNAINVVGEIVHEKKSFTISNSSFDGLQFGHFLEIVEPFPFISKYKHDQYKMRNKSINIVVKNRKPKITETMCTYNDMYEGSDGYEETTPILTDKQANELDIAARGIHESFQYIRK